MQDNSKYPRIKKIHQILEKITRIDQKDQNPLCLVITGIVVYKNYTTHQFTYFIYYLIQDNFKNAKIIKNPSSKQEIHAKQFFSILFKLSSIGDSFKFKATQETRLI